MRRWRTSRSMGRTGARTAGGPSGFLGEHRVRYEWVDVDDHPEVKALVEERNGGAAIIPTIVFADGSHLAEPSNEELATKLGLRLRAERKEFDLLIVGGGPTGLAAAIYAAREGIDALVTSGARSADRLAPPNGSTTTRGSPAASVARICRI